MTSFKTFLEETKPIVSFDFDGVLHKSLLPGTTHPTNFWNWESWEPNEKMFHVLREEAKNNRIVVVSRRNKPHQPAMWEYIRAHHLPVEKIFTTDDGPKLPVLQRLHAVRHYDDDANMANELQGSGIEFIHVT